ncbi:DUF6308 family protein [Georgenia yuyongxinii]|uniref:Uncharacterized protein n=1 Tax=Georgenia yuyongxinii TaxID=2589797 RepID=A0A552WNM2_9MICO|nr:DUF6308 family protein [Georgenia yuyongxinii]TRW44385.1 hypothetical protein FJ693_13730 [Georgenia yuyongxinii]
MTTDAVQKIDQFTTIPEGWPVIAPEVLEAATAVALEALSVEGGRPAHVRLARYYDRERKYAGATFTDLPNIADDVTADDLLAVSLLSVRISPLDVRRLVEPSPERSAVLASLRALPDVGLTVADADTLTAMAVFYEDVKGALKDPWAKNSDRWVTASKLCARKRPDLFPVRDRKVRDLLGLTRFADYRVDWQVLRHLAQSDEVRQAIFKALRQMPNAETVKVESSLLRVLDVGLWTHAIGMDPQNLSDDE